MALNEDHPEDFTRQRRVRYSPGHNPPRSVPDTLPTLEQSITGYGGPGRTNPRTQGTHPWIAGSFTIGSNHVWNISLIDLKSSSPNVWFMLRHNHSGTASLPGGTIDKWHLPAAGHRTIGPTGPNTPIRSIRGPGTITVLGFGARRALTGSTPYRALGTNTGHEYGATIRGDIV